MTAAEVWSYFAGFASPVALWMAFKGSKPLMLVWMTRRIVSKRPGGAEAPSTDLSQYTTGS